MYLICVMIGSFDCSFARVVNDSENSFFHFLASFPKGKSTLKETFRRLIVHRPLSNTASSIPTGSSSLALSNCWRSLLEQTRRPYFTQFTDQQLLSPLVSVNQTYSYLILFTGIPNDWANNTSWDGSNSLKAEKEIQLKISREAFFLGIFFFTESTVNSENGIARYWISTSVFNSAA